MKIGVPKEVKNHEYRVGLIPSQVFSLVQQGHEVLVQSDAGSGVGLHNHDYLQMGAKIVDVDQVFAQSDLIIKVKEPQLQEIERLQSGQLLFTYLHLAPDPEQTNGLLESGATAIAYETVRTPQGVLPLLTPMSEVAGRMSIQAAAHHLEKKQGGSGVLLSGIPGVSQAEVLIIGAGVVGSHALQIAVGMGARVTVVDQNPNRLRDLDLIYGNRIQTMVADQFMLTDLISQSDVVIGAVLIPGSSAPKILKREHLQNMRKGSVVVDVAIDQGGCFETSIATTHDNPTYVVDGVTHYCVANMPGAIPRTSTFGLVHATFPYIQLLANQGFLQAIQSNSALRAGVSVYKKQLTCLAVGASQHRCAVSIESLV
jgi:alanine dehydrogenase